MSRSEVNFFNICQLKSATRFAYFNDNDFDLAKKYLANYPKFKDPKRTRMKIIDHGDWVEEIILE